MYTLGNAIKTPVEQVNLEAMDGHDWNGDRARYITKWQVPWIGRCLQYGRLGMSIL